MVSAGEALGAAIHEGVLEKKRRTGGWKKKQFILTPTQLLYFDSLESASARSTLATLEIMTVTPQEADPQQRGFVISLFRKKKEYRAASTAARDAWIQALSSVAGMKRQNGGDTELLGLRSVEPVSSIDLESEHSSITLSNNSSNGNNNADPFAGPLTLADLRALCDQMKRGMAWQVQISKSFSARDVTDWIRTQCPALTHERLVQLGQDLVDNKLIVPLKSHVFDDTDPSARFKFVEVATAKQPKNHLAMRGQSIADLMGHDHFDAKKYAEDFLRKHASEKIDGHCKKLVTQKEQTIEELKEEISSNYTSFIRASAEIKTMENSVSQLKTLVLECKRSIHTLKMTTLETKPGKRPAPAFEAAEKKAAERTKSSTLDNFIYDLEVSLHERDFAHFTSQTLEYFQKRKQNTAHSSDIQHAKVLELRNKFVYQLVEDFNASMQASERMHKKEDHLKFLIQLGQTQLATEMCLQNYSVRIALQLRHVPSYGNALNYVINLSRTFFSSLLVCYEDYEHSFRGQSSSHFVSLTVWISAQLERFASEIIFHIFPNTIRSISQVSTDPEASSVAIDVPEFKNVTRYVSNALRYVFYGSRQLELAGLPTAHCLAPHLVPGIEAFLDSYASSIKSTLRDEIKRERWEMMKRSIRDPENKLDSEIILTQSGRSFYSMVQQYLRDVQRVLNPSCATSYLAEVYDAVMAQADELLVHYSAEAVRYLTTSKASSSLRLKQIIGLMTNIAYIHEDCAARSMLIVQEYLPKAVVQASAQSSKAAALWDMVVEAGMKRCAESLFSMTVSWQQLDASDEVLPDVATGRSPPKTLFLEVILKELESATNAQLDRSLRIYCERRDSSNQHTGGSPLLSLVSEALINFLLTDAAWVNSSKEKKRLGCGGASKILAEVKALELRSMKTKAFKEGSEQLTSKITAMFEQTHGKSTPLGNHDWMDAYARHFTTTPSGTT